MPLNGSGSLGISNINALSPAVTFIVFAGSFVDLILNDAGNWTSVIESFSC
jgi:hypothetical protein